MTDPGFTKESMALAKKIALLGSDPVLRVQALTLVLMLDAEESRGHAPQEYRSLVAAGIREIADKWDEDAEPSN